MKKPKLGTGKRFANGVAGIERKEGLSPTASRSIMAMAGREKYGANKMAALATAGKKRKKP